MTHDLQLELRTDPRLLASVRALVGEWLAGFGLDEDVEHSVVLAIDEACSNCIRHAYGGSGDCYARLTMRATPEHLEFEISDEGTPCRTDKTERRPLEIPHPDEVKPGGLGIQLMHRVFDEVRFEPGDTRGNRITLKLRRQR
jgi:anti-sigma regulatory factor (Ser/Thr protein kinase)